MNIEKKKKKISEICNRKNKNQVEKPSLPVISNDDKSYFFP